MCAGGLDRQEVCPAHTHMKKHAPAHLFSLIGEERDGSPQDTPAGGGHVCVLNVSMPVGEEKKCKEAKLNLYKLHVAHIAFILSYFSVCVYLLVCVHPQMSMIIEEH